MCHFIPPCSTTPWFHWSIHIHMSFHSSYVQQIVTSFLINRPVVFDFWPFSSKRRTARVSILIKNRCFYSSISINLFSIDVVMFILMYLDAYYLFVEKLSYINVTSLYIYSSISNVIIIFHINNPVRY